MKKHDDQSTALLLPDFGLHLACILPSVTLFTYQFRTALMVFVDALLDIHCVHSLNQTIEIIYTKYSAKSIWLVVVNVDRQLLHH